MYKNGLRPLFLRTELLNGLITNFETFLFPLRQMALAHRAVIHHGKSVLPSSARLSFTRNSPSFPLGKTRHLFQIPSLCKDPCILPRITINSRLLALLNRI